MRHRGRVQTGVERVAEDSVDRRVQSLGCVASYVRDPKHFRKNRHRSFASTQTSGGGK